MKDKTIHTNIY